MRIPMNRGHLALALVGLLFCTTLFSAPAKIDIIRGKPVNAKEFSWQVALISAGSSPVNGTFCGGMLIASDWVLTAAHCLYTKECEKLAEDEVSIGYGAIRLESMTQVAIEKIHIAQGYECGKFFNDIALMKVSAPVTASRFISLPSMTDETSFAPNAATLTVAGWGFTSLSGIGSTTLLEADVNVVSLAVCNGKLQYDGKVPQHSMCAGAPGKDACKGDSGGPLFTRKGAISQKTDAVLIGIVSHGDGCAQPDRPGIYSRITPHLDWIRKTTLVGVCTPTAVANNIC